MQPRGGKKDGKLNNCEGVYVGESVRSMFERAGEHWADVVAKKEDSHISKHWVRSAQ